MTDNPFRELPNTNPYAPPAPLPISGSSGNPLLLPAVALLVLSSMFVLLMVLSLPRQILRIRAIDTSTPEGSGELIGSIVPLALVPLLNVAIALGAISMIRLKNYRNAYTAALLSLIPLCSPCLVLGIPFGIWAILILNRPEVKQRFLTH